MRLSQFLFSIYFSTYYVQGSGDTAVNRNLTDSHRAYILARANSQEAKKKKIQAKNSYGHDEFSKAAVPSLFGTRDWCSCENLMPDDLRWS